MIAQSNYFIGLSIVIISVIFAGCTPSNKDSRIDNTDTVSVLKKTEIDGKHDIISTSYRIASVQHTIGISANTTQVKLSHLQITQ